MQSKAKTQARAFRARSNVRASARCSALVERAPVTLRSVVGTRNRLSAELIPEGPTYTRTPEPMTDDPILDAQGRPRSVWSALLTLDRTTYRQLVRLAFPDVSAQDADLVVADAFLHASVQVKRWQKAEGHWQVWLDAQGRARVQVWP